LVRGGKKEREKKTKNVMIAKKKEKRVAEKKSQSRGKKGSGADLNTRKEWRNQIKG